MAPAAARALLAGPGALFLASRAAHQCFRGSRPSPISYGPSAWIPSSAPVRQRRDLGPPAAPRRCCCAATSTGGASTTSSSSSSKHGGLIVCSELGMQALAAAFATDLRPGDVYLLFGAVGAGKSEFSRAFIRAAADDPYLTVPSPTFLLQQIYEEHNGPPIHHFDLYRLEPGSDMGRLDMGASFSQAVSLVEWPERLAAGHLPQQRLELSIEVLDEAEQQRLEEQLQQRRQQRNVNEHSSSDGSSGYEASEEDDWSDAADDGDPYTDRRWRRVLLSPHGRDWEARASEVVRAAAHGELSADVAVADGNSAEVLR